MKTKIVTLLCLTLACVVPSISQADAPQPPKFVPFGAYLSWERPFSLAKYNKIDRWKDVGMRLDAIAKNHFDSIWVTNMADDDLPQLIKACEKRHLKLVVSMGSTEIRVKDRFNDPNYYPNQIAKLIKLAGGSKTLVGWVLSDEPDESDLANAEKLREMFAKADPNRFTLVVSMWPQTPMVPEKTNFSVLCVDLYPFFYKTDPNGPNTPWASIAHFRGNARRMMDAIGTKNISGWIMGMAFNDIWGPRRFEANGDLVGLPGSYLHWRAPTIPETRWQIWETLRSGCNGYWIYTLAPETPDPATATLPPPDVAWKDVLIKTEENLGPNALTNPDGSATPQLIESGKVFKKLLPYKDIILRWKPDAKVMPDLNYRPFTDPKTGIRYVVVINDDFLAPATIMIDPVSEKRNYKSLFTGKRVMPANEKGCVNVELLPGEGTILQAY